MSRRRSRLAAVLALLAVFIGVALCTAWASLRADSREIVIGAQTTTLRAAFDGFATIDLGPLLPRLRLPADLPLRLGVDLDVGESVSDAASVDALISQNALIASQPAGELATVRATLIEMIVDAVVRGLGAGVLAVLTLGVGWRLVGRQRRVDLRSALASPVDERRWRASGGACAVLAAAVLAAIAVVNPSGSRSVTEQEWVPAVELVPEVGLTGRLATIEVAQGAATTGGLAIIEGAITTYNASVMFYGKLLEAVPEEGFRVPGDGETVAILVSDRHDNIGMDPVARAIGDAGAASVLITAGDETSSGGSWEAFSISSLADAFEGYDAVAAAGNHDTGATVVEGYEDAGFTVLDGEPVEVAGIRFLGDNDPRSSAFTSVYTQGQETVTEQGQRLAEVACEDGDVSTLVVHSPSSGTATAEGGCVDLVVSGHLHRQVGPQSATAADGSATTVYTNGTTGGAAYAFALGSKLRRDAQVTLLTYRDGRPIGLQPVTITVAGQVVPADYVELPVSSVAS